MVLHRNCLSINIHESIHVNLKSEVMTKPLRLCIFIHSFLSFCIFYFIFTTFWSFTCKNLQHIFPPIYDNNYFYFSILFSIRIFDAFNRLVSNSLCPGFISRLIFPIFDEGYSFFFSCQDVIFFTKFSKLDHLFGSSKTFEPCDSLLLYKFLPLSYYTSTII